MKYGINVVAVVFNDEAFGNVSRDLDESWGGTFAAEVKNPDFMKLADAYGVVGLRAEKPTDVGDLVRKALSIDRPALVEVPRGPHGPPGVLRAAQVAREVPEALTPRAGGRRAEQASGERRPSA